MIYVFDTNSFRVLGNYYPKLFPSLWQLFETAASEGLVISVREERLKGQPVADPFLIAAARVRRGCVVSEEELRPNAARIPNVCQHFGVQCTDLEGFMTRNGWRF